MVARSSSRARRLPPEERREALITATLPLVACHGPGVTTRQIAEAADVAEGTIFRVFDDKDALIRAVVERAMDPSATLRDLDAIDRGLPLRVKLESAVEVIQSRLQGMFALINALGSQGAPPGGGRPDGHRRREINEQFREAIVDVVGDDRTLLRVPAGELAAALRMLAFSTTHSPVSDGNPLTPRQIVGILLDGMLDHSGGTRPC